MACQGPVARPRRRHQGSPDRGHPYRGGAGHRVPADAARGQDGRPAQPPGGGHRLRRGRGRGPPVDRDAAGPRAVAGPGARGLGRAADIARQLLSALSVAHAAGVMHRDVKPSNVLLGRDDRAVLTDFGIATFQGDPRLTQTGMVMGSPGFTAPERIRGEDATPASDLWSLGATLFAAVEGHGPYERRGGPITTMSAIINEDAPPAPTAGALAPVIGALLRREPSDRPDAATAARMITDVLPQLPTRTGAATAGYEATALSDASPHRGETAADRPASAAGQTAAEGSLATPLAAGAAPGGGQPPLSQTPPTTPQPVLGGPSGYDQPTQYDS